MRRGPRPRLGMGGLLLWGAAILLALGMAWLDLQRMAERGEFDAAEEADLPPEAQPVEVVEDTAGSDAAVEALDGGGP